MTVETKAVQETENVKMVSTGSNVFAMLDSEEDDAKPVSRYKSRGFSQQKN